MPQVLGETAVRLLWLDECGGGQRKRRPERLGQVRHGEEGDFILSTGNLQKI